MNGGASGGGGMMGGRMGGMGMMAGRMGTAPDTAAAPKSTAVPADSAADCPRVSQALVNQGRTLFGSTGNCFACHGADAKGGQLGPNLTDKAYLDMNGTYGAIAAVVRDGVPVPKAHSTPMPPLGGAPLSDAQVCAVAAYVYSIEAH